MSKLACLVCAFTLVNVKETKVCFSRFREIVRHLMSPMNKHACITILAMSIFIMVARHRLVKLQRLLTQLINSVGKCAVIILAPTPIELKET